MESGQLKMLFVTLDDIRHTDESGADFWYARELYLALGYSKWETFIPVIKQAKLACLNAGGNPENHFLDQYPTEEKSIDDIKLRRYACYLIAINGDPHRQEIAFAQAYFVTQTRRLEVLQAKMEEFARLETRDKLKITEKDFAFTLFSQGVDDKGIAIIRSEGDKELFGGLSTLRLKEKMDIPANKPLANFLPNVTLKAKDLATAMTTENTRKKNLYGVNKINEEHKSNNKNIREALTKTDIFPEDLPPAEDIEQIKKRHKNELKELKEKQEKELSQKNLFL
ncbi:MAG: DNA damage-inducible protein D [Candidatus Paceibacterota bacterium]